jgi:hypothetical protein
MKILKHLLRFGGIYILLGAMFFMILFYIPYDAGGWKEVLRINSVVAIILWAMYGVHGFVNK